MSSMAETLDDLIDNAGIPLGELVIRVRMSSRTLLAMRRGEARKFQVSTVARLAKVLGVEPARVRAAIAASRDAAG